MQTAPYNPITNPSKLPWQAWVTDYIVTYHRTEEAARNAIKRHLRDCARYHGGGTPHSGVRPVALPPA
jgi:hypothetical protein